MNVTLGDKIVFSLYLYKVYKSKYLEENKDKVMSQDDINDNMENLKLLYLFNVDEEEDENEEDYVKFIKKFGTKVNVSGYGYNLDRIADVLNTVDNRGKDISGRDLVLVDNKVEEEHKIVTVCDINTGRRFKINVNENNKEIIIPKEYVSYGFNMLCMAEVEDIELDNEFLISKMNDIMNKNGGYITDVGTLYLFKKYIGKDFIHKWNEENTFVSVVVNYGYSFEDGCDYYYDDWEFYDDDDDGDYEC